MTSHLQLVTCKSERTQEDQLVQLLFAKHHISTGAELHTTGPQGVQDLLTDHLQGFWVGHQVIGGPEGGRKCVAHSCPHDGEVMS